jgi:hypothetical protein
MTWTLDCGLRLVHTVAVTERTRRRSREPHKRRREPHNPTPFMGHRREGRWCRGGEMTRDEWSSSILSFQGEERKGQRLFQKRKGARRALMVPMRRGD